MILVPITMCEFCEETGSVEILMRGNVIIEHAAETNPHCQRLSTMLYHQESKF